MKGSLFYEIPCLLGEGAMWHEKRQQLFWIDIQMKKLHNMDIRTKVHQAWQLKTSAGTIVPDEKGRIVIGMEKYVDRFDPDTGEAETLRRLEDEPPATRSNDGKCDPAGRFWLGTMALDEHAQGGNLYCIDPGLSATVKIARTSISNGIVWTKDRKTMYYIDSPTGAVQAFDYDNATGDIHFRKVAVRIPEKTGSPDGMTIDENDRLWVAHWGGSGVYCWDPLTGQLIEKVEVPAPHVTSCVFGGENLDTLFITTARKDLSAAQLERFPLSGSIFSIKAGVKGFPPNVFKG